MKTKSRVGIDPLKIFKQAERFHWSGQQLRRTNNRDHMQMQIAPAIVLEAFACKLYLKCLLCIETGKVPDTHLLKALFRDLRSETKQRLREIWNVYVPSQEHVYGFIEKKFNTIVPRDLDWSIEGAIETFRDIRYLYEKDEPSSHFFLNDLPTMLRNFILETPLWGKPTPLKGGEAASGG